MSSSSSPCAACKFLRRKCTQECVFAPYFPADQPQRFANVHKVFGASNVAKILNEIPVAHREDAVNSLAYEAEARLRDPVYGCVGLISLMQHTLKNLQLNLDESKKELASLVGPTTMMQMLRNPYFQAQFHPSAAGAASSSHPAGGGPSSSNPGAPMAPYNMAQFLGMQPSGSGPAPVVITDLQQQFQQQQIGGGQLIQQPHHHGGQLVIREPQQLQQQHLGAQQQLMIREQQQQQQHLGGQQQLMIREQQQQQHIVGQQQLMIREQQQQQQHIGGQQLLIRDHAQMQAQQAMDAQIAAAMQVREEQEMMRNYEQQHQHAQMQAQQHQEMMRFHGDQFGQMGAGPSAGAAAAMSPLLALGSGFDAGNPYHIQQQQQQEPLLMLQPPQQSESEVVLQIQQQQQEQHQLQDQQLFHDPHHHLHPPGPGND